MGVGLRMRNEEGAGQGYSARRGVSEEFRVILPSETHCINLTATNIY